MQISLEYITKEDVALWRNFLHVEITQNNMIIFIYLIISRKNLENKRIKQKTNKQKRGFFFILCWQCEAVYLMWRSWNKAETEHAKKRKKNILVLKK